MIYNGIVEATGNTPLIRIKDEDLLNINLYAKLEYYNPSGSVKDRAAVYIINKLLSTGEINKDTTIIESSSGNFGIALATYCKKVGLKFVCVIDPNITSINETIIGLLSSSVIKVTQRDNGEGYLLNRIKTVKEFLKTNKNSYWINQYGNPYNSEAYFNTLGQEICNSLTTVDYVFLGVSSGGTITGVSQKIKNEFPKAKVIAVDITGSVIFGGAAQKRYIPGIGSSMVPDIISNAKIDGVVMVDEECVVNMCHELLDKHQIFVGGSSGSVIYAIKKYFKGKKFSEKPNVVTIFADRGDRYAKTIYNKSWCSEFIKVYSDTTI
jgi:2,3-diaminopropionate biosynthesis protein SbnA